MIPQRLWEYPQSSAFFQSIWTVPPNTLVPQFVAQEIRRRPQPSVARWAVLHRHGENLKLVCNAWHAQCGLRIPLNFNMHKGKRHSSMQQLLEMENKRSNFRMLDVNTFLYLQIKMKNLGWNPPCKSQNGIRSSLALKSLTARFSQLSIYFNEKLVNRVNFTLIVLDYAQASFDQLGREMQLSFLLLSCIDYFRQSLK